MLPPGFFEYLAEERGLCPDCALTDRHDLDRFETYLPRVGVENIEDLSAVILSGFVVERSGAGLAKTTVHEGCGVVRAFL